MRTPLFLFCFSLIMLRTVCVPAQNREILERTLADHGINVTPQGLAAFLENGWRGARPPNPLPDTPPEKSSLFIDAWSLLTLRRAEALATPELSERLAALALQYARGAFPPAVLRIVEDDLRSPDARTAAEIRARRLEFLQYNGMVALAFFGKASPEARRAARAVYDAETRPLLRVAYARTLALLGDRLVLDDLVAEAANANRNASVLAARTLSGLFGQPFRFDANMAVQPRIEAAEALVAWWDRFLQENRGLVEVDREAAIERLFYEPPIRRPVLHTLRDLLRASADKTDIADQRGGRTAAAELERKGPALARELEPILDNPREDLDIRTEAMWWYSRLLGEKARSRFRRLVKDPNPEIAELARQYLEPRSRK